MYYKIGKTYIENNNKFDVVIVERDDNSKRIFSQKYGEKKDFIFLTDKDKCYSIDGEGDFIQQGEK